MKGPGGLRERLGLYAAHHAMRETLEEFRRHGDRAALAARLTAEDEFDRFIGFPRIAELAARHRLA